MLNHLDNHLRNLFCRHQFLSPQMGSILAIKQLEVAFDVATDFREKRKND